jgi:DNA-binding transcriptional regulator YiaG
VPNVATILKDEIARVARKELRGATEKLKKTSMHYRSDLAALKRRVAALEQQLARVEKAIGKATPITKANGVTTGVRFSAKGLSKHRERLGLSAAEAGKLMGVSAQTIYNWEAGTTRPRESQLGPIALLRRMGKREVAERLRELAT